MKTFQILTITLLCFLPFWSIGQNSELNVKTFTYQDTLKVDYYSTEISQDEQRPLILLMHGGGFASGKRNGENEVAFCREMADKGYAVASMEYRLTRLNDPFNCDCSTEKKIQSFISASEDLATALEFLQLKESLVFDRDLIVLVGSSAGAETILHWVFMGNDYRFKHIPTIPVSGLISFSGAVSNASYINENNAIPTLLIHGKQDDLVPYGTAPHHFCSEDSSGYLMLDGPKTISEHLAKYQTPFILAYNEEGNHDWADTAYLYTELVDRFIKELVVEGKTDQSIIELKTEDHSPKEQK